MSSLWQWILLAVMPSGRVVYMFTQKKRAWLRPLRSEPDPSPGQKRQCVPRRRPDPHLALPPFTIVPEHKRDLAKHQVHRA